MSARQIGFIGLGNMGGRIARRLIAAGHRVRGYDTQPGRAGAAGAEAASSPAATAAGSDCILLSVPDSAAVEDAVLGAGGLAGACERGQIVVDLTTAAPASTMKIHAALAARGVEFLDAGISGGAAAAEKGALTIMVGGSASALEHVRWVFEPIAAKVVLMGGSGAGHITKLLNNFLNGVSLAATAEVMVAARKAGLDLGAVLEVINTSSGVNFATLNRFPHIINGDYLEGGLTSALMMKDVALYVSLAGELGVPSLSAPGPLAAFGAACNLGYADQISNRVVDAVGDLAGGIRLHDVPAGLARKDSE
jgi:3-hydroxyisobutyrate dehydrogenase